MVRTLWRWRAAPKVRRSILSGGPVHPPDKCQHLSLQNGLRRDTVVPLCPWDCFKEQWFARAMSSEDGALSACRKRFRGRQERVCDDTPCSHTVGQRMILCTV